MGNFDLERVLTFLPGIILGLTVHEYCHALVAHMCGDSTSKDQGRVTLNPLKHIDPIGFMMLIFVGFGWAKPVQFNEENLNNPKTDVLKIALAGPLSNAVLAMILSVIFSLVAASSEMSEIVYNVFIYAIYINWGLFVFNLIPLPPLDGSHLLLHKLKSRPELYNAIFKYGSFLLFGLIIGSMVTKIDFLPIGSIMQFLTRWFLGIVGYSF
jgi:Zn-dependent protease